MLRAARRPGARVHILLPLLVALVAAVVTVAPWTPASAESVTVRDRDSRDHPAEVNILRARFRAQDHRLVATIHYPAAMTRASLGVIAMNLGIYRGRDDDSDSSSLLMSSYPDEDDDADQPRSWELYDPDDPADATCAWRHRIDGERNFVRIIVPVDCFTASWSYRAARFFYNANDADYKHNDAVRPDRLLLRG